MMNTGVLTVSHTHSYYSFVKPLTVICLCVRFGGRRMLTMKSYGSATFLQMIASLFQSQELRLLRLVAYIFSLWKGQCNQVRS